ncbi:uncharacterized protein LOC144731080 [Lampetra planeri]
MDMNGEFSVGAEEDAQMEAPQVCPEKTLEDCSVDLSDEGTGRAMYVKGPKITRGDSAGTSARNGWSTGGTETIPGIPERVPRRIPQVCPEDEGREASESAPEEEAAGRFPRDGRKATPWADRETSPGAEDGVAAAAASAARDPEGGPSPAPAPGTGGAGATKPCGNCRHLIAVSNLSLHETHCFRNLLICARCEERVPRTEMEEHMQSEHTEVTCKCGKALERCKLEDHVAQECPRQAAVCRYCGLEQPRATTWEHEDFCGARTERCAACLVYVQKQDEEQHRLTCPGHPVVARDPARAVTDAANATLAALRALHDDPDVMSGYEKYMKFLDSDDDEDDEGSLLGGSALASSLRGMMTAAAAAAQFTTPGLPSFTQGGGGRGGGGGGGGRGHTAPPGGRPGAAAVRVLLQAGAGARAGAAPEWMQPGRRSRPSSILERGANLRSLAAAGNSSSRSSRSSSSSSSAASGRAAAVPVLLRARGGAPAAGSPGSVSEGAGECFRKAS